MTPMISVSLRNRDCQNRLDALFSYRLVVGYPGIVGGIVNGDRFTLQHGEN